jgi:hypothetical protein
MVDVTQETPHIEYTIQGLNFSAPQPFKIGHVLTEGEAEQLNQDLAANLRNNFAAKIRSRLKAHKKANNLADDADVATTVLDKPALDKEFADYASKYQFGMARAPAQPKPAKPEVNPVDKVAAKVAWEKISEQLRARGIRVNTVDKAKRNELIGQALSQYPAIRAEAERRVQASNQIALDAAPTAQAAE